MVRRRTLSEIGSGWTGMLRSAVSLASLLILVAACSGAPPQKGSYKLGRPYQVDGRWYYPEYDPHYDRTGVASWYGEPFHGRPTANGEVFDRRVVTAAHPTLPLPSLVRVTNLENGRELTIRVNDRGPFVGDRIIDLSQEAARQLGFERQGTASVRVQFVRLDDAEGTAPRPTVTLARSPAAAPSLTAERARPRVREAGLQLAATQPPGQAIARHAEQCNGRFIQVGAFAEPAHAQRVVAELHALKVMPVSLWTLPRDRLARVRLGPIADPRSASAALDRLKRSGFSEAFIVAPEEEPFTTC
jgi:peptidoglycan lytic transglycosylase